MAPGSSPVCTSTCGVRPGPPMQKSASGTRRMAGWGWKVASTARSRSRSNEMSHSWQCPSVVSSSRVRAWSDAVRQLGQMRPQRSSKSPAGTACRNARSTSRRSSPQSSASAKGRARTTSASAPRLTNVPSRSARAGATRRSRSEATAASTRRGSAGEAGSTYGLGPPATWASMVGPNAAKRATNCRALIQATGRSTRARGTISRRTVARVPPSTAWSPSEARVLSSVHLHVNDSTGPPCMRRCTLKARSCVHSKGSSS